MAKMKVHELAKELDIQSKDIVSFLQGKGCDVKAPQSSVDDEQIAMVKNHFAKDAVSEKEAQQSKTTEIGKENKETEKMEGKPAEQKKKKNIIFVSNPHNSKMPQGSRPPMSANNKKAAQNQNANVAKKTVAQAATPPAAQPTVQTKQIQLGPNQMINKATGKIMEKLPPKQPEIKEEVVEVKKEEVKAPETQTPAPRYLNSRGGISNVPRQAQNERNEERSVERTERNTEQRSAEQRSTEQRSTEQRVERTERQERNERNNGDRNNNFQRRQPGDNKPYGQRQNEGSQNGERRQNNGRNDYRGGNNSSNREGYQNNKGNHAGNGNNAGNNRFGNNNERNQGRNERPDNRFQKAGSSKPFMDEPIVQKNESKREEQRRINQNKDKRSKKDSIYEDDGVMPGKNKAGRFIKPEKKEEVVEEIKVITLPEVLTIKELAEKMKMQPAAIIKKLFMQGQIVTVNQEISYEEAENIAIDYEIMCEKEVKVDVIEELLKEDEENTEDMIERAPVICVMGHVDHGKTSLLDAIRKTNVTDREAGGITQHIGAYTVTAHDRQITFLDTPGHEAFTAMRMRGANATDIAILVVAADDGVMPQTVEAINHAKAAGIEIIVAVNKIDKPSANIERVKQELTEYELISEDWGGSTIFVPVSAKTGEGIADLLDMVLLTADVLELKANPKRKARGLVIEAELDKGRGPVATVLVQKGTLKVGDFISAGASHGKVRAMIDDKGKRVKEAGPSTPVEILGLNDVPNAGEVFLAHENDKTAKSFADTFIAENKNKKLEETKSKMSLDDLFNQIQEGNLKELNLIVKADVQGSVEAVKQSLTRLSNEEVVVKCIHGGVGAINESDVTLAAASSAIIIGFNVRLDASAKDTAEREGVDVRLYRVIYQAIEDVEAAMKGMLDPIFEEKVIGHAEVRQIFKASAIGNIAGSYILDGEFKRGCKVRITREGEQIYEGELASLKRFKDDVKEVKAGFECGLVFEGFDKMQEFDIVEAYIMVEVPR